MIRGLLICGAHIFIGTGAGFALLGRWDMTAAMNSAAVLLHLVSRD